MHRLSDCEVFVEDLAKVVVIDFFQRRTEPHGHELKELLKVLVEGGEAAYFPSFVDLFHSYETAHVVVVVSQLAFQLLGFLVDYVLDLSQHSSYCQTCKHKVLRDILPQPLYERLPVNHVIFFFYLSVLF